MQMDDHAYQQFIKTNSLQRVAPSVFNMRSTYRSRPSSPPHTPPSLLPGGRLGEPGLPVLAAPQRAPRVGGSAADDAACPAAPAHLQAGASDEEGGAGGAQGLQGDFPGQWCRTNAGCTHAVCVCVCVCVCVYVCVSQSVSQSVSL